MNRRISWIDYAKTLAIFTVVLIHTHCDGHLTVALKSFTMPVFFFISGFLFSYDRNPRYGAFAYKRFRQLVVPYLWINAVAYVAWLAVLRHMGGNAADGAPWHEPLIAALLGLPPLLVHDIPLWSLLCFFVVEMVYYPVRRHLGRYGDLWMALAALAVASAISLLSPEEGLMLPLSLAPASVALVFYALGHAVASDERVRSRLTGPSIPVVLMAAVSFAVGVAYNTPVNFFMGHIGNPLFFLMASCGGSLLLVQVSAWLGKCFGDAGAIRLISRGTLLVCGFHLLAFAAIKGVMLYGFGVSPSALTAGIPSGLAMSVGAVALCVPLIMAVERWARPLVSK